jgi:hypothetical protein
MWFAVCACAAAVHNFYFISSPHTRRNNDLHAIAALKHYRKFRRSLFALHWNLLADNLLKTKEENDAQTDVDSRNRGDAHNTTTSAGWMHLGGSGGVYVQHDSPPSNKPPQMGRTEKLPPLKDAAKGSPRKG